MITVLVSTGKGIDKHYGVVEVNNANKLTPKSARAALEIAGYYTGQAWYMSLSDDPNYYDDAYGYRVYHNSVRKIY